MNSNVKDIFQFIESNEVDALNKALISNPSLANKENEQGLTPLGFAAHYGNKDIVQLLLNNSANVNAVSHSKIEFIPSNTALHAAIAGARNLEVIELLLNNQANPAIFDSNGHTALHTAVFHDDNIELINLLIKHGASVQAMVEGGKTALELAIELGNNQVAEKLHHVIETA
ncbi:ankyrin repeat domain-containing protein [Solibacillus daqui]|uniref:ankyrin repeat domain-containing protein n=1 Tax=Solibacillus daqui TaxID=2912187 RepID=UPI002365393B|nr:ankyrin repeat domain-containing protein [Solibacillus daqui]